MGRDLLMRPFWIPTVLLVVISTVAADGWPQWRGPGRNGLAERSPVLVNSFPAQTPLWQSEPIPSGDRGGRGSLVIHENKVYGLAGAPMDAISADEVFCLDTGNGKTVWKTPLPEAGLSEAGSSTPCIAKGRLYVVGSG